MLLRSLVIGGLRTEFAEQNMGMTLFYFDYRDQDNQSPTDMVASLLGQLAILKSSLLHSIMGLHAQFEKQRSRPQLKALEMILLSVCRNFTPSFIVINTLDECDTIRHRRPFLQALKRLESASIRLLVISRPLEDIKHTFVLSNRIEIEATDSDIRKYLTQKID
jgi:hypothetical protein